MDISNYGIRETAKGLLSEDIFLEDPPDMHDCTSDTLVREQPAFQVASPKNFNKGFLKRGSRSGSSRSRADPESTFSFSKNFSWDRLRIEIKS